jgi:hypothetical protein
MEMPSLFDGLAEIGLRGGVDMRPTLIRVLTDLFVQKLKHTPEEERHYAELALRLLDTVDTSTRATIATKLARHLAPPLRVVQYLVNDLPEVAAPLRGHAVLRQPVRVEPPQISAVTPTDEAEAPAVPEREETSVADELIDDSPGVDSLAQSVDIPHTVDPMTAGELNEMFFSATEDERRLILLNLHVVVPLSAGQIVISRDPAVGQRLEAAALGNYREDLAKQFALALHVPHEQARRITGDNFGEPMAVAVKALGIPRDVFHRILMFANPAVGHSVERVQALAALFDEMTLPAAEGMIAIWQALPKSERIATKHQTLFWNDEQSRARPATAIPRRPQNMPRSSERRNAS